MPGSIPPTTNERVIAGSLPCIRCGYDLDKSLVPARCPECGTDTSSSLESLWLQPTEYVATLRRGARTMIVASLIGPLTFLVCAAAALLMQMDSNNGLVPFIVIAVVSGPVVASIGVWVFSRRSADESRWVTPLGPWARATSVAFAGCYLFGVVGVAAGTFSPTLFPTSLIFGLLISAGELWCIRNILVLARIRALARVSNMRRISAAVPALQVWCGLIALGGLVLATILVFELNPDMISGRTTLLFLQLGYVAWLGLGLLWLGAWPIVLARLEFGLKQIVRQHKLRGRPVVLDAHPASLPPRAAPPTSLDPPAQAAP